MAFRTTPSRSTPSGGGSSGRTRVGKYELGRTLGEGTFAKVKFARNVENGDNVAIKVIDKEKVLKNKMIAQIKREISTMKLIKHPNVIRMFEVMASKTKIYFVLEFVTGGELFDKISTNGRLKEDEARKYFQQLINTVDYCHSRGVYHRDLKPENLLLDANGALKVSDFGLSALPQQVREDGLLHTTCGTPNYVAPEVINNKGYDGAKADLWSCGVILFVLMAGYLPFEDSNLTSLYKKIFKAEFTCPPWFSASAKKLIKRILDPNPATRITFAEVIENEWFKKGYKAPKFENANVSLDDVDAIFDDSGESKNLVVERREEGLKTPVTMNAFELISTSQGLNLGSLFEKQMGLVKRKTRFTSKCSANEIVTKIEAAAAPMGFDVKKNNYKMKLLGEKSGRKGQLAVATEVFQVAPSLYMVEMRKSGGDTLEFHKFYKNLTTGLKDIVWKTIDEEKEEGTDVSGSTGTNGAGTIAKQSAKCSLRCHSVAKWRNCHFYVIYRSVCRYYQTIRRGAVAKARDTRAGKADQGSNPGECMPGFITRFAGSGAFSSFYCSRVAWHKNEWHEKKRMGNSGIWDIDSFVSGFEVIQIKCQEVVQR